MPSIGSVLKYYREQKGLSVKEVAERLDLSPSTISHYETNRRFPNPVVLRELGNILEISDDEVDALITLRNGIVHGKIDPPPPGSDKEMIAMPPNISSAIGTALGGIVAGPIGAIAGSILGSAIPSKKTNDSEAKYRPMNSGISLDLLDGYKTYLNIRTRQKSQNQEPIAYFSQIDYLIGAALYEFLTEHEQEIKDKVKGKFTEVVSALEQELKKLTDN